MDSSFQHLISLARPFPFPIRHKGLEVVLDAQTNPHGLVLCSVHLPLVRLALTVLVNQGVPPTAVVARETAIVDGMLPIWGTTESLPALAADRNVLLKCRTILRDGGFVAAVIDEGLGDPLNRNVFRVIRSVGARVLFVVSELQQDGAILIDILSPPDPFCRTDESVLANISFLQDRVNQVLHLPSSRPGAAAPPLEPAATKAAAGKLELDSSA